MHFFGQFTDHNSERKHGNWTNDPVFLIYFFAPFVMFNCVFEKSQNLFWCHLPFGPFWSVKYLNFGQKLLVWTIHHTFLEIRHTGVTKNPYYVLIPSGAKKRYQLMDYYCFASNCFCKKGLHRRRHLRNFLDL